ncbi:Wzz/FepE/Etk N-terminal domain-containing protein [Paenibacillus sp. SC116]|uniref:YveK family protein n=1 Tax=Paenibacillus sp. SC116 TaxID=2968986 RepID=UPI00215B6C3B|nr:Wzz/FepE/Etk N-terminal domain-containing protein [Paenibacillus sp. SC116]MCR8842236.1 Wzz/FepE/Etk N-terminal domain-containing protein [Paenibacillus sp. SC116]
MEVGIKEILQVIRKRSWWLVTIVVLASVCAGIVSLYLLQPKYEASSQIIISSTNTTGQSLMSINEVNMDLRLMDTYKEIIKTVAMMKKVTANHPDIEHTPEELSRRLQVNSASSTQVITLSYQHENYSQAVKTVNAIVLEFQREIPSLMNIDNVSILGLANEEAVPAPVSPNIVFNVAVTFMISLVGGVALFVLLEMLDDTVKSEEELARLLNLPVLATVNIIRETNFTKSSTAVIHEEGTGSDVTIDAKV